MSYTSFLLFPSQSIIAGNSWNQKIKIFNQPPSQNRNNNKWNFSCKHLIYFNFYLPSFLSSSSLSPSQCSFLIIFITGSYCASSFHFIMIFCSQTCKKNEKRKEVKREVKQERLPNTHACKCKRVSTQCLLHSRQTKSHSKRFTGLNFKWTSFT